ncbi:GL24532 [Drosophila persimilis]|uniref:GL24532 n=1 Tax=Drosophila persimilis TaxID=7234 RepID=B4G4B4_DROPE|nr:GL24532 [Drosophila persimilis]
MLPAIGVEEDDGSNGNDDGDEDEDQGTDDVVVLFGLRPPEPERQREADRSNGQTTPAEGR